METNRDLRLIASPDGFTVFERGKKLHVSAADIMIRPGSPPLLQLALPAGNVDLAGAQAVYAVVDTATGRPRAVRRIIWADGGETEFPAIEAAAINGA